MQKRIIQVLPTVLLALLAPLTISANEQQPTTTPQSIEQLLGDTSYDRILAPQDFKAEGTNLIKGQPIANGLSLSMAGKLKDFSPAAAIAAVGKKLDLNTPLAEIKALKELSLNSVVASNPEIANLKASAVNWAEQGEKTLGELAASNLGKLPLPDVVLNSNSIGKFGNIANTPYSQYLGAEKLAIDKFPDLAKVPIAQTITAATGPNVRLVRVNKVLTKEKNFNTKVVSGSDQRPKAKWDKSTPVSGVELVDSVLTDKSNLTNGAVAIIGSTQMLPGGNIPSPLEPTGFDIPGTPFKMSFEDPKAKDGSVAIQLNLKLQYAFGLETSNFIPVPTGIRVSEASKTTLLPLEVPLPDSIGTVSNSSRKESLIAIPTSLATPELPKKESTPNSPLTKSPNNMANNLGIVNGQMGEAVKTNAFNPAISGGM